MKENNSSKEPKSIVTRISHKIQKTLGVSNITKTNIYIY